MTINYDGTQNLKEKSFKNLDLLAQEPLRQIIDLKYDTEMVEKGISPIYEYGVAFKGKMVEIAFSIG